MSNSPTPWTVRINAQATPPGARVYDASGNLVALFTDARDADFVVNLQNQVNDLEIQSETAKLQADSMIDYNDAV